MPTELSKVTNFVIYKEDNNIDRKDNLEDIPSEPAIYAIAGRINGEPANCRFVGETSDLRKAIKHHFSDEETHLCLKQFMQSIKIKTLDYVLIDDEDSDTNSKIMKEWEDLYKPECSEELNEVF